VSIGSRWAASGLEGWVSEDCALHRSLPGRAAGRPGVSAPSSLPGKADDPAWQREVETDTAARTAKATTEPRIMTPDFQRQRLTASPPPQERNSPFWSYARSVPKGSG